MVISLWTPGNMSLKLNVTAGYYVKYASSADYTISVPITPQSSIQHNNGKRYLYKCQNFQYVATQALA